MFDIGFWELVLVGVVALIVVGPERLPGLARSAGLWVGKARYLVNSVTAEVNREMKTAELQRFLDAQARIPELHEFVEETRQQFTGNAVSAISTESNPVVATMATSTDEPSS